MCELAWPSPRRHGRDLQSGAAICRDRTCMRAWSSRCSATSEAGRPMPTLAQITDPSDEHVLLPDAALDVSNHIGKFVSDQTLRRAARRIGALRIDARGHYTIPRSVVEVM